MADEQYVDLSDEELAEWRAQHPGRDRPRVVSGRAESIIDAKNGSIPIASDD